MLAAWGLSWSIELIESFARQSILRSVATAVPKYRVEQEQITDFLARALSARGLADDKTLRRLRFLSRKSGVKQRYSVLSDYACSSPDNHRFYGTNSLLEPIPTMAQRMTCYEKNAVFLAEEAARRALQRAAIVPSEVTHLIISTCTGFFAPGPDILLIDSLGLNRNVQRTQIGFMGCYAGFTGLRTADTIVKADPEAVVLQVAVELCSLHLQMDASVDNLTSSLLFADGAGAAVYTGPQADSSTGYTIKKTQSEVGLDSLSQMSWRIGDHGFIMTLDSEVPRSLHQQAPSFVDSLLDHKPLSSPGRAWAIHPGGPRILEEVADSLHIDESYLQVSKQVLESYGNMSSATIFFVLDALTASTEATEIVALGFGPGLTIEGCYLKRSSHA